MPSSIHASLSPRLAAWHRGEHLDLLGELRLLTDAELPNLPAPGLDRSTLAEALAEANRGYGHPRSEELADRLADPETRVVITGQQPGLFGGPLYSLLKMLGAVLWAEALDAAGTPTIPLFWVATEDHDYDEVAAATFWNREPITVALPADETPLRPVGDRALGAAIDQLLGKLNETYGWPPFPQSLELLARSYRPEARFGEAFMSYAVDLLGDRAPLFVDSQLRAVKEAQAPLLRRLIEERKNVDRALLDGEAAILGAGFDLQVQSQPGAAPLLSVEHGERRRIVWAGDDSYSRRGSDEERPVKDLLQTLEDDPSFLTPNVLSRPVLQDALFGTGLQVLGPGELSYFAQASPLYPLLGVPAPAVVLRPQALLFEARQGQRIGELGLPPELLVANDTTVDAELASRLDLPSTEATKGIVSEAMETLRRGALTIDPNLENPWEKTLRQMHGALDKFSDRLTRAAGQRDAVQRSRLDALRAYAAPAGTLHERVLSTAYFHGRFGQSLVPQLLDGLDRTPARVQLLTLEDAPADD